MLKVGDKLICKERLVDWYTIGRTYNIINTFSFGLLKSTYNDIFFIWRFFYSPNELRKLKLKELEFMQKV
jgi:hypothetical protein